MKRELADLLENRVSLRSYKDQPIRQEDMNYIMKHMMCAPTAGNMMLYSVIKIEDKETKRKLAKTCDNQAFIARASSLLIFCADYQRWYDYYDYARVPESCEERNLSFRTPTEGDLMISMSDAMIASAFAAIAAEACNIGTCYIGDIVEHYEIHKELLNLPKWVLPVGMLCLGYYPDHYKKNMAGRFNSKFIVHNEKYHRLSEDELNEMMSERVKTFSKHNKFQADNFGQFNYFRKNGNEFNDEMTRSFRLMIDSWSE